MHSYRARVEAEIDEFIGTRLVAVSGSSIPARDLYEHYVQWHSDQPVQGWPLPAMEETMFGRLAGTRLVRRRTRKGQQYLGVALR
jgi:hypothetical protein